MNNITTELLTLRLLSVQSATGGRSGNSVRSSEAPCTNGLFLVLSALAHFDSILSRSLARIWRNLFSMAFAARDYVDHGAYCGHCSHLLPQRMAECLGLH